MKVIKIIYELKFCFFLPFEKLNSCKNCKNFVHHSWAWLLQIYQSTKVLFWLQKYSFCTHNSAILANYNFFVAPDTCAVMRNSQLVECCYCWWHIFAGVIRWRMFRLIGDPCKLPLAHSMWLFDCRPSPAEASCAISWWWWWCRYCWNKNGNKMLEVTTGRIFLKLKF